MPTHGGTPILTRAIGLWLVLSLMLTIVWPPGVPAQPAEAPDDVTIYDWFEEVPS